MLPLLSAGRWHIEVLRVQGIYSFATCPACSTWLAATGSTGYRPNIQRAAKGSGAERMRAKIGVYLTVTRYGIGDFTRTGREPTSADSMRYYSKTI